MTSDEQDGGLGDGAARGLGSGPVAGRADGLAAMALDDLRALGAGLEDRIKDGTATLEDYGAFVRARQELARRGEDVASAPPRGAKEHV